MSTQNLVSASLTAADQQAVSQKIAELRQLLPFLIDLTMLERQRLLKMGDSSRAFVEKALAAAQNNPKVLPGVFNTAEFAQDLALWTALQPIASQIAQLGELIEDTQIALGSDLMVQAMEVYRHLGNTQAGAGLEELRKELGLRFYRRSASATTAGATATTKVTG
ncbi:MAG TPA: hypothetical protein VGD81_08330 [Opitutaceae bacterium]